jgi:type IV secretory pathway TraG/TraD family ATPase VirD4
MPTIQLSRKDQASHTGIYSDTGGGKTLTVKSYLQDVERRGEVAVVWDPDREYARKFRSVERGDWILDPGVAECPYWPIAEEVQDEADAIGLATCQFPDNPNLKDPFWTISARGLFAYLLTYVRPKLDTAELGFIMAHDHLIDKLVKGSEFERMITKSAPNQRSGVIGHMNTAAQPLRMMPAKPEGRRKFLIREYCRNRRGWIFITSSPSRAQALKPLHSIWLGSLIMRTLDQGYRPDLPRLHFILEEASTVTISEFHTALVRARKTDCPIVYCIQNFADLKAVYGDKATSIFSQPMTKIFYRTSEPESANKLADTIGKVTVKRLRETRDYSVGRRRRSFSSEKVDEYLIPPGEIQNLPDRSGYLLQPGVAVPIVIPIVNLPDRSPAIIERIIPPMERRPLTPEEAIDIAPEPPAAEPLKRRPVPVRPKKDDEAQASLIS